mgnify:CR=1 FL=1
MNGKQKGAFLAAIVLALGQAGVVQGAAPESITLSPRLTAPLRTQSSKAMAMDAAEVLPYFAMSRKNFSMGSFSCLAAAWRIRAFAW